MLYWLKSGLKSDLYWRIMKLYDIEVDHLGLGLELGVGLGLELGLGLGLEFRVRVRVIV